jgi:hypothetical protein
MMYAAGHAVGQLPQETGERTGLSIYYYEHTGGSILKHPLAIHCANIVLVCAWTVFVVLSHGFLGINIIQPAIYPIFVSPPATNSPSSPIFSFMCR